VAPAKIKDAQTALLTRLWKDNKLAMQELEKGDKPTDSTIKILTEVAKAAAKGFESK
jgi:hypothetical protein